VINRPPKILVIKSDVSELKKVENLLVDIFNEFNFERKYFNRIYLCISEAVLNAIKHGNKNDLKKNVSIAVECTLQDINVEIEDEGSGFDINKVKDPTCNENVKNESGRGIFIIRKLSNKIEYNEKGNRIQFKIECK
jgi:serine/threonine-protein kinase RsbW